MVSPSTSSCPRTPCTEDNWKDSRTSNASGSTAYPTGTPTSVPGDGNGQTHPLSAGGGFIVVERTFLSAVPPPGTQETPAVRTTKSFSAGAAHLYKLSLSTSSPLILPTPPGVSGMTTVPLLSPTEVQSSSARPPDPSPSTSLNSASRLHSDIVSNSRSTAHPTLSSRTVFKRRALALPPPISSPNRKDGDFHTMTAALSAKESKLPRGDRRSHVKAHSEDTLSHSQNLHLSEMLPSPCGQQEGLTRLPLFAGTDNSVRRASLERGMAQSHQLYRPAYRRTEESVLSTESAATVELVGKNRGLWQGSSDGAVPRSAQVVTVSSPRSTNASVISMSPSPADRRGTVVPVVLPLTHSCASSTTSSTYSVGLPSLRRSTPVKQTKLTHSEDVPLGEQHSHKTLRDAKAVLRKHAGSGGGPGNSIAGASIRGVSFHRSRNSSFYNRSVRRDDAPNSSHSRGFPARSQPDLAFPRTTITSIPDLGHPLTLPNQVDVSIRRESFSGPLQLASENDSFGCHRRSEAVPLVEMLNTSVNSIPDDPVAATAAALSRRRRAPSGTGMFNSIISDPIAPRSQQRYGQSFRRVPSTGSRISVMSELDSVGSPGSDELHKEHQKKVNAMMMRLTATDHRPVTPTASHPLMTEEGNAPGRDATTSWAGIGTTGWALSMAPGEESTHGGLCPTWNVAGTGEKTAFGEEDSDDFYARMRRKVAEEEDGGTTRENMARNPVPPPVTATPDKSRVRAIIMSTDENSDDFYARMRRKVVEEEVS